MGNFLQGGDYWVLELTIKGDKTNTVTIHIEYQIAIRRYLEASGHGEGFDGPLFRAVKAGKNLGEPLNRYFYWNLFKRYALAVGLPPLITPYSARATFITQAYEAGLQKEDIQRTVDHASITTIEGYNRTVKRYRKSASFGVTY